MSLRRVFALSLILGLRNVLFCVICSVASTRGLKRISIAISLAGSISARALSQAAVGNRAYLTCHPDESGMAIDILL